MYYPENWSFSLLRSNHYYLWNDLRQTGGNDKSQWCNWDRLGGDIPDIKNHCFACLADDIARAKSKVFLEPCSCCPIDWGNGRKCDGNDEDNKTLYELWRDASSDTERAKYARLIRDLSWTDKISTKIKTKEDGTYTVLSTHVPEFSVEEILNDIFI